MDENARHTPTGPTGNARSRSASILPARQQFAAIIVSAALINIAFQFFFAFLLAASPLLRAVAETIAVAMCVVPPAFYFYMRPLHLYLNERQGAEERPRKSEMHYRIVSELTTTFVFDLSVDKGGRVSLDSVSDDYYSFAGRRDREPASFETLFGHIYPDDAGALTHAFQELSTGPKSAEVECRVFVGDPHELRWISIYGRSEWDDAQDRVTAIYGAVKDITESKAVERVVAENNGRLQRLADSVQGFIAYVRADTLRYEFVNETYARQFGLPREKIVGSSVQDILGEDNFAFAFPYIQEVRSGRSCSYENSFELASGTRWVQVNYFPVLDGNGRVESIAVLNYDITERKRADEEQARVQDLLEVSQRLAHIGSWEWDLSTGTFSLSDEMYRIAGLPVGTPISREIVESFFPPDELARSRSILSHLLREDAPYVTDYGITRHDGRSIVIHNEGEVIRDERGEAVRMRGTTQDITARKQAEDALRESEQVIDAMLNAIPAGVFWKDTRLAFVGCNSRFAREAGFDHPDEIVGKDDYEIGCPREYADAYRRDDRRVMESGMPMLDVEDLQILNGKPVAHLTSKVPLRNAKGQISGVLGTFVDITERKLAEEALQESEDKFRSIIEQSSDGIVVTQQDGSIVEWNHSQEAFTGLKEEKVLGTRIWDVQLLFVPENGRTRELLERMQQEVTAFLRGEKGRTIPRRERRIVLPDSTDRFVSESAFLVKQAANNIGVFVLNDITDRKNAENDKIQYEQYLQRAQKLESLGMLAGGIAHDFNNILMGVFGFVDLARDRAHQADVTEYLTEAMRSIDRAKALTDQLLTFSKGGAPQKKITPMTALIQEVCQFALHGSNIGCAYDIQRSLWQCNVDRNQVGQVIQNLVLNAVQAMPMGGTIRVTAANLVLREGEHPTLHKGNYVQISVKDQGIGISQEMLPRIFDPFFTTKSKGHGLGLAISYSIINRHAGAMNVQSELGKGTTMDLYLPAEEGILAESDGSLPARHEGAGRILVMDDEEPVRRLISKMLESFGYTVVVTENGKDTLEAFTYEKENGREFAAVILDLTIPGGMGGKEVAHAIRHVDSEVPLFVASGYAGDPIVAQPQEYGFTAGISKPFRIAELSEMLAAHLKNA
jgi:PAS domain S-box-containing protein